jgi:hypothetical protein
MKRTIESSGALIEPSANAASPGSGGGCIRGRSGWRVAVVTTKRLIRLDQRVLGEVRRLVGVFAERQRNAIEQTFVRFGHPREVSDVFGLCSREHDRFYTARSVSGSTWPVQNPRGCARPRRCDAHAHRAPPAPRTTPAQSPPRKCSRPSTASSIASCANANDLEQALKTALSLGRTGAVWAVSR